MKKETLNKPIGEVILGFIESVVEKINPTQKIDVSSLPDTTVYNSVSEEFWSKVLRSIKTEPNKWMMRAHTADYYGDGFSNDATLEIWIGNRPFADLTVYAPFKLEARPSSGLMEMLREAIDEHGALKGLNALGYDKPISADAIVPEPLSDEDILYASENLN